MTAVSDDHRDPSPITPANLTIGRPLNQLPDVSHENLEESVKRIMERYLYLQRLLNHYWKRWKQEHHLTMRNKWRKEEPLLQLEDIVLVSEGNVSRGEWPLARVTQVHPGRDGLVRTATVQTQKSVLNRPVQLLHRLEITSATSQVIPKDAPVRGGEKLKSNCVNSKNVSITKSKRNVTLSKGGQDGENVKACYTRSGRLSKKPNRLDL